VKDANHTILSAIGHTPLIELPRLSSLIGRVVLGKCEFMNPGGSVKDRPALQMVKDALAASQLAEGGTIVEGTAGNTGIGLALVARAYGLRCVIVMPNTQSPEKIDLLRALGAEVELVPAVPFHNDNHFYHTAKRRAAELGAHWCNQFENEANWRSHHDGTAAELWAQCGGRLDGFICSAGTGGTIAGITSYLAKHAPHVVRGLIDPTGSSLFQHVTAGTLDTDGSSHIEGIGIRRITNNFAHANIQLATQGTDAEAVAMAHWLRDHEGVFLGMSAALNVVGAVKLARTLPAGARVATILCDGGGRGLSRLYNHTWLREQNLEPGLLRADLLPTFPSNMVSAFTRPPHQ
jgi:cysteine synthase